MQLLRSIFIALALLLLISTHIISAQTDAPTGADADATEDETEIPSSLLEAAAAGDVDAIKAAIAEGSDIDTTNVNGWSAASFAVSAGKYEALQVRPRLPFLCVPVWACADGSVCVC